VRIRAGKREIKDDSIPVRRSRAARFYDPDSSFGKRSAVGREKKDGAADAARRQAEREEEKKWEGESWRDPERSDARKRAAESDRRQMSKDPEKAKFSKSRLAYLARNEAKGAEEEPVRRSRPQYENEAFSARKNEGRRDTDEYRPRDREERRPRERDDYRSRDSVANPSGLSKVRRTSGFPEAIGGEDLTRKTSAFEKRMPVSIPYTTPASSFLYGTAPVMAALQSKAVPRRKLYKLYIYRSANRDEEAAARDKELTKLARRQGVDVEFVREDFLRVMDKMSAGRPHNGYILEASPLPQRPIVSLGEVRGRGEAAGFDINLDYQSREDAAVNGTGTFIPVPSMQNHNDGRKPLVLLLDGIVDPGNLGGIIRTAGFLGVTAVAISTRASAGFSPVVLKASAGASENVTLFSVSKPAGFVADSRANGWKVYAAVAPSNARTGGLGPKQVSTDDLFEPLAEEPALLMLGSEGEGLRAGLKSKADVEICVKGWEGRKGVDSLNVSVAAGILCASFLRRSGFGARKAEEKVKKVAEKKGDLF
jgi:21S rRNA (GM2251-2'-O)-methyltransferase